MKDNEIRILAEEYLDAEQECQRLQAQMDHLKEMQRRLRQSMNPIQQKLLNIVGASIIERIIPIGKQAIIVSYHPNNTIMRISNRVVASE